MKVQVEEVSPVEKRLSIEVDPAVVEQQLTAAYVALARQVKMPGFRPGKVPRRILEKHYRAEVEADVIKRVQVLSFYEAIATHQVSAVGEPHFTGGRLEAQKPYEYTARVEVKPTIVPQEYKGLALTKHDAAVTDDKVLEQLERLRAARATLVPVADRQVVEAGDVVKVDFEATVDGQPFPGNSGHDATFEVAEGLLTEGRVAALAGATIGAAKEVSFTFPDDAPVEQVRGKEARFLMTPKSLQKKDVPALDDALAVAMGQGNLETLRQRVRADMERARKREVETQEREEIFSKLAEKNAIVVPRALVQRGVEMMLESALGSMARSGMDLRSLNLDWDRLRGDLAPRAEAEVRGQLLLEAIARVENVAVSDDDVEQRLAALAEEAGVPVTTVRKQYGQAEARENLRARVRDERVIGLLKASATYGA